MRIVNGINSLNLRVQVVFAVARNVPPFDCAEADAVRDSLARASQGLGCTLASYRAGGGWVEAVFDADATFELARAMASLKAVTSRRVRKLRGGPAGIWAPGYAAASLGEPLDPPVAAAGLSARKPSQGAAP